MRQCRWRKKIEKEIQMAHWNSTSPSDTLNDKRNSKEKFICQSAQALPSLAAAHINSYHSFNSNDWRWFIVFFPHYLPMDFGSKTDTNDKMFTPMESKRLMHCDCCAEQKWNELNCLGHTIPITIAILQ